MQADFKVFTSGDPNDLEKKVTEKLVQGYTLHGDLVVTVLPQPEGASPQVAKVFFTQAVVRG